MSNIVMITGATSGIGRATTEVLAAKGNNLILICRNRVKMDAFIAELNDQYPKISIIGFVADFSSSQSIRECVSIVNKSINKVDVLINNAGTFQLKQYESKDGYELTFAVNYLGTFLFTKLMLPILKKSKGSRIVNVGSDSHYFAHLDLDDLSYHKRKYTGFKSYSASKLAILYFTQELSERLKENYITVNCVHPGQVATNIWNFSDNPTFM